jgi:alpha-beta hydrolase superfamily lysophospholipase
MRTNVGGKEFRSTLVEFPFGSSVAVDSVEADSAGNGSVGSDSALTDVEEGAGVKSAQNAAGAKPARGIILYVHGYNDYFFQKEMAQKADSAGYAFFAIDLHYCGRSFAPGDRRGDLRNMREFFPELDFAVELARVITKERTGRAHLLPLVLIGHSQGGLLVSFYAESRPAEKFAALVLNSPFFDFNFNWLVRNVAIPVVSELAMYLPDFSIGSSGNPNYAYAINRERYGEWQYNTEWKSEERPEQFLGWIRGVHRAQLELHRGFHINSPVLVLHGDCSEDDDEWSDNQMHCDGVLDVEHIEMWAPKVGTKVTTETVAGGLHDLYLSRKDVRDEAYAKTFNFIDESLRGLERAAD